MQYTIETMPAHPIAFIRTVGPYGASNASTMQALKDWAKSHDLLRDDSTIYGIAHDNPNQTIPENCRYDACLALETEFNEDELVQISSLQGGKYAIFVIPHSAASIQGIWQEIFSLLNAQMDMTRPILERYQAKLVKQHKCEICIPIQ